MYKDFVKKIITYDNPATFVEYGYGQVEPNHLSAQRTGQIYAQLPAASTIDVLQNGQFAKYDYANGVVDFTGEGEWMLVYNEIKLYRGDEQADCEFAMKKGDYQARLYSPGSHPQGTAQTRYYNGVDSTGATSKVINSDVTIVYDDVTAGDDPRESHYNEDPFHIFTKNQPQKMPEGTTMVPRLFKTNIGDIFTTNTVKATVDESGSEPVVVPFALGDTLTPGANGILEDATGAAAGSMLWQVVKIYTMPDGQAGLKLMRIA
jgi:hypothetical protein